ncbi:MAG: PAS domain S-box protein [Proteobacteria bacterium]|nr:PAS domain S-box protein [Pseudomonadota bacterium]
MLSEIFLTGETRDWVIQTCLAYSYDTWLVLLSCLVAMFASYTAFHLVTRVSAAPTRPAKAAWLVTGAVTMGGSIWSMHFIAMLAVWLPAPVRYDVMLTGLSVVFAIAASGFAFYIVTTGARTRPRLFGGGVVLGAGIGAMHYTGMAAIQMDATILYDPFLFAASVLVAVSLSTLALRLLYHSVESSRLPRHLLKAASGCVMGLSIAAMHYTAMAATYFLPTGPRPVTGLELDASLMAGIIGAAAFVIAGLALIASIVDRFMEIKNREARHSESFLAAVVNNTANGIIAIDEKGAIRLFNPAAERMFGYARSEVVGENVSILLPLEEREAHEGYVRNSKLYESRILGVRRPLLGRCKDGTSIDLAISVSDMQGDEGRTFIGVCHDITERKQAEEALKEAHDTLEQRVKERTAQLENQIAERRRAEEALRQSEEQVRLLLNSTAEAIYGIDLEGNCTFCNPACVAVLGYDGSEDLLGRHMHDLIHHTRPDSTPYLSSECLIYQAFRKGRGTHVDDEVLWRKDGTSFPVEYWSHPIRRNGEIVGAVVTFLDTTERKRSEEALREARNTLEQRVKERTAELERQGAKLVRLADDLLIARDEARAADRAKSEFLAAMSHELRTPLNAIIGFSEIIKGETFGPVGSVQYRDYASDIHESGQHLLALINDILDLSKVESGVDELHEENIEVPEILESVLRLVQQRAENSRLELELDLSQDLPSLWADERKLKQILVNLLTNAIKFTDAGGKVTLRAWCRRDSGFVFQIIDTGIGIAAEDIPKALSQFGQVDSDLDRQYEGTGLGLPLTKALVELHGGCFDLQSRAGVGTTATVRFPATRIIRSRHGAYAPGVDDRVAG